MNSDTQEKPSNHYAIVIYQSILKTCFIWQLVSFWILNWNFSFASVWQILQHPSSQGLFQYFSSFYASLHAYNVHTALCNALSNSLQYDSWAQSSHTHTQSYRMAGSLHRWKTWQNFQQFFKKAKEKWYLLQSWGCVFWLHSSRLTVTKTKSMKVSIFQTTAGTISYDTTVVFCIQFTW